MGRHGGPSIVGQWCQAPQGLGQGGPFSGQGPGHSGWGPLLLSPLMQRGASTSSLCPELPPAPRGPRVHFSDSQSLPRTYPLGGGHWRLAVSESAAHPVGICLQDGGRGADLGLSTRALLMSPRPGRKGSWSCGAGGWGVPPCPPTHALSPQMDGGPEPPLGLPLPICEELARGMGKEGDMLAPGPGVHCGLAPPTSG